MAAGTSGASHLYYDISGRVVSNIPARAEGEWVVCPIQRRREYCEVVVIQIHVHICVLQKSGEDSNDSSRENSMKSSYKSGVVSQ